MAASGKGVLKLSNESSAKYFVVFGGFLQVKDNRVIVLADSATAADKINLNEAEEKLAALKTSLDATTGEGEPEKADELRKALEVARINYRAARLAQH